MKKILIVLAGMLLLGLCIYGSNNRNRTESISADDSSVKVEIPEKDTKVSIHVSADLETKFSIPDPETSGDQVEISLFQEDQDIDYEERYTDGDWETDDDYWDEYDKAFENRYLDVSFLGLKEKVYVTAFQVAAITDSKVSEMEVSYAGFQKSRETENKQGNCIVIALGISDENEDYEAFDGNDNAYLAVLDYQNKKSYLFETTMFARDNDVISCYDLTGDGKDEIVYFNDPNKSMCWEVYQFDQGKLSCLYGDQEDDGWFGKEFKVSMLDDYKLKIKAKKFGYEETISIKELGIKKSDMEVIPASQIDEDDWLSIHFRCYKDGKVQENIAFVDSCLSDYRAYDSDEVWTCLTKGNASDGLKIPLNVCLTKWVPVGKAYAIVKYNEETNRLEMVGVDTEWRKIDRKKELYYW